MECGDDDDDNNCNDCGDDSSQAQRVELIKRMSELYSLELKERIDRKMETMGEKREAQLAAIQERLREHVCSILID